MRKLLIILVLGGTLFAQSAANYFPSNFGHVWFYKVSQLDTNDVPIDSASLLVFDSLATESSFESKTAKIILEAYGDVSTGRFSPPVDTSRVALEGSIGYVYIDLTALTDTALFVDKSYYNLLKSLSRWYDLFHFNAIQGLPYVLLQKDTTVTIDSVSVPLRFEISAKRLSNETLETVLGSFTCKKFQIVTTVSYLQPSPLGTIPIPLVTRNKYVWIAPQNWIVKEFAPTRHVDLSALGGPQFVIPGSQKVLINRPTEVSEKGVERISFRLLQNYPNPFNPTTTIEYSLKERASVSLSVYNSAGQKVAELVNGVQDVGNYQVNFQAGNLSSGVYFYRLKAGKFTDVKKMLLLK